MDRSTRAYALALSKITGADIHRILPTPNIPLDKISECQKYLAEGAHRRLYTFSPADYKEMAGIWGNGKTALPTAPPGDLEAVDGMPEGGKNHDLTGVASASTPDYAPEEMFEVVTKLYKMSRCSDTARDEASRANPGDAGVLRLLVHRQSYGNPQAVRRGDVASFEAGPRAPPSEPKLASMPRCRIVERLGRLRDSAARESRSKLRDRWEE